MNVVYKDEMHDNYICFERFSATNKDVFIETYSKTHKVPKVEAEKEWNADDWRQSHAIRPWEPRIKYMVVQYYLRYVRLLVASYIKTEDFPADDAPFKRFMKYHEKFIVPTGKKEIDQESLPYSLIRDGLFSEQSVPGGLPGHVYVIANFLPQLTFGNQCALSGNHIENVARYIGNQIASVNNGGDVLYYLPDVISVYGGLFNGEVDELKRFYRGIATEYRTSLSNRVAHLASQAIAANKALRHMFYFHELLPKSLDFFISHVQRDRRPEEYEKLTNLLKLLACTGEANLMSIDALEDSFAMQSDVCQDMRYRQLNRPKMNNEQNKKSLDNPEKTSIEFVNKVTEAQPLHDGTTPTAKYQGKAPKPKLYAAETSSTSLMPPWLSGFFKGFIIRPLRALFSLLQ